MSKIFKGQPKQPKDTTRTKDRKPERKKVDLKDRTYDLMIFFNESLKKTVEDTIKVKNIKLGYIGDHFAYIKSLSHDDVEAIEAILKPCSTTKHKIYFQATKEGEIDKLLSVAPPRHKKPTHNTVEARRTARANRKIANRAKAEGWKQNKIERNGKARRMRVKNHTTPDRSACLSTLQKKLLKRISKASKVFVQELDKKPVKTPKKAVKTNVVKTHHKVTQGELKFAS